MNRDFILEQVKSLLLKELGDKPVKIYLFGSWARQEERRTSDIDVAIAYEQPLPVDVLSNTRLVLEESTIPYRVELVDLTQVGDALLEKVKKEGVLWKD